MRKKKDAKRRIPSVVALSLVISILMIMISTIANAAGITLAEAVPGQAEDVLEEDTLEMDSETVEESEIGSAARELLMEEIPEDSTVEAADMKEEPTDMEEELVDTDGADSETYTEEAVSNDAEPDMAEEDVEIIEAEPDADDMEGIAEEALTGEESDTVAGGTKPPSRGWKISGNAVEDEEVFGPESDTLLMDANSGSKAGIIESTDEGESVHAKIDISDITGEIAEPPEITSQASALATEKQWYEYIYYSDKPVGFYYVSDQMRVVFYDPYDYSDSLVMEINDTLTDWSSNNSMSVSYTTGNSLSSTAEKSTETTSTVERANGQDISETTTGPSTVETTVEGRVNTYNWSKSGDTSSSTHEEIDDDTWTVTEEILGEIGSTTTIGISEGIVATEEISTKGGINISNTNNFGLVKTDSTTTTTQLEEDYSHGYTEDNTKTIERSSESYSRVTSTIADRLSNVTGVSASNAITISSDNSTTITKTYDAGYFNSDGVPLQWKIIKYTVMMPMMYQVEFLVDGEWIINDYSYCLLTTIQGTCRAWLENNTAYYEHWGTGEKVTWDEFWSQFFTKEELVQAYQNRLYPDR